MEGTWTIPFPSFAIKATDLKQALSQNTQKGEMFSQNQGDLLGEKKKRKKKVLIDSFLSVLEKPSHGKEY